MFYSKKNRINIDGLRFEGVFRVILCSKRGQLVSGMHGAKVKVGRVVSNIYEKVI